MLDFRFILGQLRAPSALRPVFMTTPISSILTSLHACTSFEDVATQVLGELLGTANRALAQSPFASTGRLLRAMVHIRPEGAYRRLAVLEFGKSKLEPMDPSSPSEPIVSYLPSATAWRYVAELRVPIAVDVHLAKIEPKNAPPIVADDPISRSPGTLGGESVARLLRRAASHLYVLPLSISSNMIGMISIELECQRAIGRPLFWPACSDELQLLADLSAAYFTMLPQREAPPPAADSFLPVTGASTAALIRIARVFAEQDETLLIGGPTGAGKSRLARWCHQQSSRSNARFETLDLMTIPEELQMGELFGWKKGAFSGAAADNQGSLARADKGTLFIDEIDKLSLKAQAGLLRVLEERTYRPLGEGVGERKADVRFIVGTNADLLAQVQAGRFREDLFYRIHVLPVRLPPLDDRRDEIPGWAKYMLERRHRERVAEGEANLTQTALNTLLAQRWPGNLRQLDNVIRRAYSFALIEQGGMAPRVLILDTPYLERALGYEVRAATETPVDILRHAAGALVREARHKREQNLPALDLDMTDSLRGLTIALAAKQLGSIEAAFRLLNKDSVVQSRNHRRAYRRDIDRAIAVLKELGPAGEQLAEELLRDEPK